MTARNSVETTESVTWQTAAVSLGWAGLDLRQPADPRALSKLINARFRNERAVERRAGHIGSFIRDGADYPQGRDGSDNPVTLPLNPVEWVYGHGQLLEQNPLLRQTSHYPQPRFARGVFDFNGRVVWTGDRLLTLRDDAPALGQSAFWNIDNSTVPLDQGIPAYLPVQTEGTPPDTITGTCIETCLTDRIRVTASNGDNKLTAWVTDRDTGVLISKAVLDELDIIGVGDTALTDVRIVESGAFVLVFWRDSSVDIMYVSAWTGVSWTAASTIDTNVLALDVAVVSDGVYLLWRVGGTIYIGKYSGKTTQSTPFPFRTALSVTGNAPNGPIAFAVAPNDAFCVAWQASDGLKVRNYTSTASAGTQSTLDAASTSDGGLTVCSRRLSRALGTAALLHSFVIFSGTASKVSIWEINNITRSDVRYNSKLASKAFRVGDEVFCWLRSTNSSTHYLVAGAFKPQMSAIADREEALARPAFTNVQVLSQVVPDPLDPYKFTWGRPYITGQAYARAGNARIGDINFLPPLSAIRYGKSFYLAGSLVRNWDGSELGDAGFHDYPKITGYTHTTGGSLTIGGTYQRRVYPVRYNRAGERFMGAAITDSSTLTASNTKQVVQIATVPATNSSDVVFEVYRTEAGGTTFYLEGTIANTHSAASVSFDSIMSDAQLISQVADPHEVGVAGTDEVEEFGPLGCSFLAVAGDRLWGAGGQVPRGQVQFSKLKEPGEGAGFDALAGIQEIDNDGGDITSIVGYSDALAILERDKVFVLFGTGPDNYGSGNFSTPQLVLADGATTHLGTAVTQAGIVYWGVNGPRLLTTGWQVQNISLPVQALTASLQPSGVQVDLARQEVVWYTESGDAVLLNYQTGTPRWAQWTGLKIAGCSASALVTTEGRLLTPEEDVGDDGHPFEFALATGELRPEEILQGHTQVRRAGLTGRHHGDHDVRFRVFYDGAPLWSEEFTWEPATETYLTSEDDISSLTPAQADALQWHDKSGSYETHKRLRRQTCDYFRVEVSDRGADHSTFTPHELVFELGRKPGLGRTAVNTFKD